MYTHLQSEEDCMPIIGGTEVKISQNPSGDIYNTDTSRYTIPKRPVLKREHSSKISWSDWEKNYNSSLLMSRNSIWETNFRNNKEKKRFSAEIKEMQSQKKIKKCKTKKELDKVKEEYARMMALSCVYKKFGFAKFDPMREEREKLTKKNLEMFEESYKAHIRCRSRSESPKSEQSMKRQTSFYRLSSPNSKKVEKGSLQKTTASRSRSPSPGETVNGIKGFNKLFPAIANKKPTEDKKKIMPVTGSSVTHPKIRPQSDIPLSSQSNDKNELRVVNVSKITRQSLDNSGQTNENITCNKVDVPKQAKDKKEKLWKNPQDFTPENKSEETTKSSDSQVLAPNSTTALMFAAYKQKFENTRQSHSEPPMRLRFMMQLREASANLEPIPERPKSFMPAEFRSVHSSRQFLEKEVKKVLHAWSPSVQRRKETQKMLQASRKPVIAREKTLSAIMRDFRVYVEESRADGRFPPIYKERYIFPDLG